MIAADANTLHGAFIAQARRTPERIALYHGDRTSTFAELDARSSRVAAHLRALGLAGGFVGLHLERSIEYVIGALGILKADGAVVPLPPSYPESRLRELLTFADLPAIVGGDPFDGIAQRVIRIPTVDPEPAPPPADVPDGVPDARPEQPAYVLSSSGSTGHPKMIVRSHESFFHRLRWTWEQHPFEPDDVCVQKSHMTTTHAIYELFEPLLRGVPVRIVPDEDVRQLESLWARMHQWRVSRLLIVPSMLEASLAIPAFATLPLRVLVLMGEHVSSDLARRVIRTFAPPTRIFSIYGSTEASSALLCDVRAAYREDDELPLGRPLTDAVRAHVLDDDLHPVSAPAVGMLFISGTPLFSGYYKEPALTDSVLTPWRGDLIYRTQDRVELRADGSLRFVGRVDDTVKIRGFRVDLRDVERAVSAHPGVRQCVVLPTGDPASASSLIAFVVPRVDAGSILEGVRGALPHFMVPASVVGLDGFPLTASGKVDRRRLLAEYAAPSEGTGAAFDSATEHQVAAVWREILGHGRFGRDSSFLEIGGTSLSVFSAVHRLRARFSLTAAQLSDLALYRHQTLADLSAFIDAIRAGDASLPPAENTTLVRLKRGSNPILPPLFLIASAGGTLGAYAKVVEALGQERDVIGIRDPFLWGERDPTQGFQAWVSTYVNAVVERQGRGPFYLAAYSSAGAFGWEIARRLRDLGHEVALLALIDPLALDRADKRRFGYWALEARFRRQVLTRVLRAVGPLRRLLHRGIVTRDQKNDWTLSPGEFAEFSERVRTDCEHLARLSALLQLNTNLPFSIALAEMMAAGPEKCLGLLLERTHTIAPETDLTTMERLVVQYELQVQAQHRYRLQPYAGDVCLFEPHGPYVGLESAQIRPYVKRLRTWSFPVPSASRSTVFNAAFPERIRSHYLCMRDDTFAARLAHELDVLMQLSP